MRIYYFIFFFVFTLNSNSQNWNVFNKNYRYNYKFNNSQLVSNVLFADTVKQTGADTTYIMNNIGVVTGSILTINKPQFLMKKIIKLANGDVKLQDTTNITIIPTCSLNQTWLFDTNYNLTATCVATATQTIFNLTDSVKTIIVNNVDTVVLSKQFGIIQFPKLYAQNKYYRLVGIEEKSTYTLTALYGEKVPNAWDFYDYLVGSVRCYSYDWYSGMAGQGSCRAGSQIIKTKLTGSNSYVYNIDDVYMVGPMPQVCPSPFATYSTVNTSLSYTGLTSSTLTENSYPGKVFYYFPSTPVAQIVEFGRDNTGRFYKYIGTSCQSAYDLSIAMPNNNTTTYYTLSYTPALQPNIGAPSSHCWGVAKGKVVENNLIWSVSGGSELCASCFGTVGLPVYERELLNNLVYPNPANSSITIPVDNCKLFIYDVFGKAILIQQIENKRSVDVSELPNGIYFTEIQTNSGKYSQKVIIQH